MKKNRLLAMLMALAMVLAYMPAMAFAEGEDADEVTLTAQPTEWTLRGDDVEIKYTGNAVTIDATEYITGSIPDGGLSYQWYEGEWGDYTVEYTAIEGATSSSYSGITSDDYNGVWYKVEATDTDSVKQSREFVVYVDYIGSAETLAYVPASATECYAIIGSSATGAITIASGVKFTDGKTRTVTQAGTDGESPAQISSVSIPSSVTYIYAIGFKEVTDYDDDTDTATGTLISGFTIYGTTGTYAQTYANKYGITFRDLAAEARNAAAQKAAALAAAQNINKATVTAADIKKASDLGATSITLGARVKKISKNAFKGTNITTIVVKTKKLKASRIKNSLKGSKVSTIKVDLGKKKVNKTYIKKYKKIFTKKISGKKAKVK